MFQHLYRTFGSLFRTPGSKAMIIGMAMALALVPVIELLVIRMFADLITEGRQKADHPSEVIGPAIIFFVAFAGARVLHHFSRFGRVLAVRYAFKQSGGEEEVASRAAWEWALAFEIFIIYVVFTQAVLLCGLFIWMEPVSGLVNAGIVLIVIVVIARIYQRNYDKQMQYVAEQRPTPTEVGARVAQRILDSELGAASSSVAMAFALGSMLYFTLDGRLSAGDAVVLLLGSRVLYGQLGQLASTAMRFGRAIARAGGPGDGLDGDEDLVDNTVTEAEEPQAFSESKRTELVRRMIGNGKEGDLRGVREMADLLSRDGVPNEDELKAQHAAEAFAGYARSNGGGSIAVGLAWQARPWPGVATDWLNPLLLQHFSGSAVTHAKPGVSHPHLVLHGRLAKQINGSSIVVGAGALPGDVLSGRATYVSVRGPLTAGLVKEQQVTRFGEPLVLASRAMPLRRPAETNGRLALVRHPEHLKTEVELGDTIDELSMQAGRADALRSFLTRLTQYDGVVTTSLAVVALCQSYGIPYLAISFGEPTDVQRFAYEDHALGLGVPVVLPTVVGTDLAAEDLAAQLAVTTVDPAVLDNIEDALHTAVAIYAERYEDLSSTDVTDYVEIV